MYAQTSGNAQLRAFGSSMTYVRPFQVVTVVRVGNRLAYEMFTDISSPFSAPSVNNYFSRSPGFNGLPFSRSSGASIAVIMRSQGVECSNDLAPAKNQRARDLAWTLCDGITPQGTLKSSLKRRATKANLPHCPSRANPYLGCALRQDRISCRLVPIS